MLLHSFLTHCHPLQGVCYLFWCVLFVCHHFKPLLVTNCLIISFQSTIWTTIILCPLTQSLLLVKLFSSDSEISSSSSIPSAPYWGILESHYWDYLSKSKLSNLLWSPKNWEYILFCFYFGPIELDDLLYHLDHSTSSLSLWATVCLFFLYCPYFSYFFEPVIAEIPSLPNVLLTSMVSSCLCGPIPPTTVTVACSGPSISPIFRLQVLSICWCVYRGAIISKGWVPVFEPPSIFLLGDQLFSQPVCSSINLQYQNS